MDDKVVESEETGITNLWLVRLRRVFYIVLGFTIYKILTVTLLGWVLDIYVIFILVFIWGILEVCSAIDRLKE